ncbi:MAG: peptide ABC transporter substrate-binding protein [Treponema sp.]|jgi:peptide/nickel transport system substrate-binding protein|nr:peptide ABC transporter substrate-binding protein [Treponema sp.]
MKRNLSSFYAAILMCCIAATVFAGGDQQQSQTSGSAQSGAAGGGTLVMGEFIFDTQMAVKNPFFPANTKADLLPFMYETLMYFNPIAGKLEPAIATGYEWGSDNLSLTFAIRDGIVWHDGKPLTAADVAYTYDVLKTDPMLDRFGLWKKLSSVEASGNKVIFRLSQRFPSLPYYTNDVFIVPKHIWEALPSVVNALNEKPIGSGPFIWTAYNSGTDIQFTANKQYWRGAPKLDAIVCKIFNSSPNLMLNLIRGDIYASLGTMTMPSIPELLTKPGAKIQVYNSTNNFVVAMNNENPLLADVNVRKAMSMAVNVGDLITKGEYNAALPTSAGWLSGLFGELQSEKARQPHVYDPAGAMALLERAGYSKGRDGIYQKNGKRLSFTYHNASGAPAQQMEAGMIQQWLLNIGIEIIPRLATWAELTQLLQTGRYDLLQNQIAYLVDPYAALNTSFHSSMTAPSGQTTMGTNYFRYRNPQVDALLDQVSSEMDPAKQKELYYKIQDIIIDDVPFIPMYLGGHIPYYDGGRYSGWDTTATVFSTQGIIKIYENK